MVKKCLHWVWNFWWMALPVAWGVWLVYEFGVNSMRADDWAIANDFFVIRAEGFRWSLLWEQNNEHRMVLPRLLLWGVVLLTDFNTKIQAFVNQLFVWVAYFYYILYARVAHKGAGFRLVTGGFILLVGMLCFHAVQFENFLWGFQAGFLTVMAFSVMGLFHLDRAIQGGGKGHWVAAICAGGVASFSVLQGLLFFPVAVAVILLTSLPSKRACGRQVLCLTACGAIAIGLYFWGYQSIARHDSLVGKGILPVCTFFFKTVSFPLVGVEHSLNLVLGALVTGAAVLWVAYLVRVRRVENAVFPLGLILFGFFTCGIIAIGRASGPSLAFASRYTTYSLLIYIGLLLLAHREGLRAWPVGAAWTWARKVSVVILVVAGMYLGWSNVQQLAYADRFRTIKGFCADVALNYKAVTLGQLDISAGHVDLFRMLELMQMLEQRQWSVFAKPPKQP